MANGRIELTSSTAAWRGYILWTSTESMESNSSTVTAEVYAYKADGYTTGGNTNGFTGSLSIGGSTKSFAYTNERHDSGGVGIQHCVYTVTVPHHAETGQGSVEISAQISGPSGTSLSGKRLSGSGVADLGAIFRASTISADRQAVRMGEKVIFSIDRKSTSMLHYLYYYDALSAKWVLFARDVEGSYSWTVPDLAAMYPDCLGGKLWILCVTFSGSTNVGSNQVILEVSVPDASIPLVEGNALTMGTAKTITCPRASSNFTVELTFTMGDITRPVASGKLDRFTWTPGYDYARTIPALTSGTGTLRCVTYNGSAKVGENSIAVTLIVPENEVTRPRFLASDLHITRLTELTGALGELYIRGRTGARAQFTAQSEYSSIKEYFFSIGSVSATGNPATIDTIVNEGEVRLTARVTDARGFSAVLQTSIMVYPYQQPKITPFKGYSEVICQRAKSTGELSADGTYLAIKAGRSFSSFVVDGVERNSCQLRYRYRQTGAEGFGDWAVLLGSGDTQTQTEVLVGGVVPSTSTSYDVELEAVDALGGRHTLRFQIMTSHISFALYDGVDGAGFGKYPEQPHVVDIAAHMTLLVRGKLAVLGADWEPLELAGGVYESSGELGRVQNCKYRVSEGNHVYAAFNCSFVHSGLPVTVNGVPIPEGCRPAREVRSVCAVDAGGTAMVCVTPDGFIQVEWVKRDGETGDHAVLWIDGYLDYWI